VAILWQQTIDSNHYEVRSAGASIRLYRNGVNHSQWNPNRPLSGSIWDLIILPALYRPQESISDICILGFGAGAVGQQLAHLLEPQRITGVEMDPMHLSIAGGFFDCNDGFEFVAADAVEWVHAGGNEGSYDVVIEDLYGEEDGMPVRCVPMDVKWCEALARLLKPGGILIFNLIEPDKLPHFPVFQSRKLRERFSESILYRIEGYENRVLALSEAPFESKGLKKALDSVTRKFPACRGVAKRYIKCRNIRAASMST